MKCPKCGYNSFEYNDTCPKCLNNLTGYKATYGLKAMALPLTARTELARSMAAAAPIDNYPAEAADVTSDMFSFDFEEHEPVAAKEGDAPAPVHDPFSFDDEPAVFAARGGLGAEQQTAQAKAEEEAFSSLLETTRFRSAGTPAVKSAAAAVSTSDEFDLENFSWDDTLDAAGNDKAGKPPVDDFDSLFGGTKK